MHHNRIRAAVMGGLDGVITLLLVVVGGLGIREALLVLVAGALSMGIAEFASVSAQRDAALKHPILPVESLRKEFNPWDAGISSFLSFAIGGGLMILPLVPHGHHWDSYAWVLGGILLFMGGSYDPDSKYANLKGGFRLLALGGMAALITYGLGQLL